MYYVCILPRRLWPLRALVKLVYEQARLYCGKWWIMCSELGWRFPRQGDTKIPSSTSSVVGATRWRLAAVTRIQWGRVTSPECRWVKSTPKRWTHRATDVHYSCSSNNRLPARSISCQTLRRFRGMLQHQNSVFFSHRIFCREEDAVTGEFRGKTQE